MEGALCVFVVLDTRDGKAIKLHMLLRFRVLIEQEINFVYSVVLAVASWKQITLRSLDFQSRVILVFVPVEIPHWSV